MSYISEMCFVKPLMRRKQRCAMKRKIMIAAVIFAVIAILSVLAQTPALILRPK